MKYLAMLRDITWFPFTFAVLLLFQQDAVLVAPQSFAELLEQISPKLVMMTPYLLVGT